MRIVGEKYLGHGLFNVPGQSFSLARKDAVTGTAFD